MVTPAQESRIEDKLDTLLDRTARMDERLRTATDTLQGHDAAIVAERARVDATFALLSNRIAAVEGRGKFTWGDIVKITVPLGALGSVAIAVVALVHGW